MRRLMSVIGSGRADLKPLVTHRFRLEQIEESIAPGDRPPSGRLRIAVASSVAPALMAVLLPFRLRYP